LETVVEVFRLVAVGLIAGLFSSYLATRDHRYRKWWELRVEAYQELIHSLSDLVYYFDKHYDAEIENRDMPDELEKKLHAYWDEGFTKVRRAADAGSFLFSENVNSALIEFKRAEKERHATFFEAVDSQLGAAHQCLKIAVKESKADLQIKKPWF